MASTMYLATFFMMSALGVIIGAARGSSLVLEKTPSVVNPLFTKDLTLRCSLHDVTVAAKSGVSDVTVMEHNITNVMSIVIYKETKTNTKEYIAVVMHSAAARSLTTGIELNVTGDMEGHSADQGYLQVVWDRPSYNQKGTYRCEVNMIDHHGLATSYSVGTTVAVKKPTLKDVVNQLYRIDDEYSKKMQSIVEEKEDMAEEFNRKNQDLTSKTKALEIALTNKTAELTRKTQDLNNKTAELTRKTQELNSKNSALESELDKAKHIEMGEFDCDQSGVPGEFPVNFTKRYTTPPRVYVTGVKYHWEAVDRTTYYIYLTSVTTTGFSLRCDIPNTDMFYALIATWISLPN